MNVTFRVIIFLFLLVIIFIVVFLVIELRSSVSHSWESIWLTKAILWVWIEVFMNFFLSNANSILISLAYCLVLSIAVIIWKFILVNFTLIFCLILIIIVSNIDNLLSLVLLRLISVASHSWYTILLLPSVIVIVILLISPLLLLIVGLLSRGLSLNNILKLIAYTAIVDIVHRLAGYIA